MHDYFPRYSAKSRIGRWFDERLPFTRLVYDSFVAYPIPRNLNYWYTFGGILAFMLGVQIVTEEIVKGKIKVKLFNKTTAINLLLAFPGLPGGGQRQNIQLASMARPSRNGRFDRKEPTAKWSATTNIKWKTPIAGRGHSCPSSGGKKFS